MREQVGDLVSARSAVWQVIGVEGGDACRAVRLARVHPAPAGMRRTLVLPFDVLGPVATSDRGRVVRPASAARAALALVANARRWSDPFPAIGADVALLWWQLVPAITLLRGEARTVLVADAVGLGKTIQAGLLAADLLARSPASRVLALVPAGLRDQWREELRTRLALDADIVDLDWLEREARALPRDVNPWSLARMAIASLDFAKRAEILPGPDAVAWDLVIVDEAHTAGATTDRGALVDAVCGNASAVMLLTATPHNGQPATFERFLRIGARTGDRPLAIVRRTCDVVGLRTSTRRNPVHVMPSASERHLWDLLARYANRVRQERGAADAAPSALAMQVMLKRAASSAWAFEATARRRRALLAGQPVDPVQHALPFDPATPWDEDAPDAVLGAAGMWNGRKEQAWLGVLIEAARHATPAQRKVFALVRLLRRAAEPALVFTEYRDTLGPLARALREIGRVEVLHGGQAPADRTAAVRAFTRGDARVLVATDAASEGLNLHHRCRLVVLVDLPWTPTRLHQRIGRVDRLGQRRRVHAVALVAREEFQRALLARLDARDAGIAAALDSRSQPGVSAWRGDNQVALDAAQRLSLQRHVVGLLGRLRGPGRGAPRDALAACEAIDSSLARRRPWIAMMPDHGTTRWSGAIAVVVVRLSGPRGEVVHRSVVGLHVPLAVPRLSTRAAVRAFAENTILRWRPRIIAAAREAVMPAFLDDETDWRRRSAIAAAASARTANRHDARRPAQSPLFGNYAAASRAARPGRAPERPHDYGDPRHVGDLDDIGSDPVALQPDIDLLVVMLRAGPGQHPGPEPAVQEDRA